MVKKDVSKKQERQAVRLVSLRSLNVEFIEPQERISIT